MDYGKRKRTFTILVSLSVIMLFATVYLVVSNQGIELDTFAAKNCQTKTLKCSCAVTVSARECVTGKPLDCQSIQAKQELKLSEAQTKERECNAYENATENYKFCMREFRNLEGFAKQLEDDYESCRRKEQTQNEEIDIKIDQQLTEKCYTTCDNVNSDEKNAFEKLMDSGNTLK